MSEEVFIMVWPETHWSHTAKRPTDPMFGMCSVEPHLVAVQLKLLLLGEVHFVVVCRAIVDGILVVVIDCLLLIIGLGNR